MLTANQNLLKGRSLRNADGSSSGVQLRDLDQDGKLEVVSRDLIEVAAMPSGWFPPGLEVEQGKDTGIRFVDVNEDGFDDVIFSNGERYSLHLWKNDEEGWATKVIEGTRNKEGGIGPVIPMIVRPDGTNNGAWFHSRSMWVQNEDTNRLPDLVDRMSFDEMLKEWRQDQ